MSAAGIILTAAYFLTTLQRMFFGTIPEKWNALTDVTARELVSLVPLAAIIIALGLYPSPILNLMTLSVNALAVLVHSHAAIRTASLFP